MPLPIAEQVDFSVITPAWDLADLHRSGQPLIVATCHPNYSGEEFHTPVEVTRFPAATFRNHGPVNRPRQRWLLREQVRTAVAAGAKIIVVPEYGLHENDRPMLSAYIQDLAGPRPLVVVAGSGEIPSFHGEGRDDEPPRANRVEVWVFRELGQPPRKWHQDKYEPAVLDYRVPDYPTRVRLVEDMRRAGSITVLRTRSWVVAVLICRDAMTKQIIDQLGELGVNLCIVPSYSPAIETTVGRVTALSTNSQAVVVLANTPAVMEGRMGEMEAAFGGPFRRAPHHESVSPWDRNPGPGVWIWKVSPDKGRRRRPGSRPPLAHVQWLPTRTATSSPQGWLDRFTELVNLYSAEPADDLLDELMAMHSFPATWRGAPWPWPAGDTFETALRTFLDTRPALSLAGLETHPHGLLRVLRFRWTRNRYDEPQWTCVLAQQPDGHWLGIFHDSDSPPNREVEDIDNPDGRPVSPAEWEQAFDDRLNVFSRPGMPSAGQVKDAAEDLCGLYAPYAVYLHRPGRAMGPHRGNTELEKGFGAVLKRGPTFTRVPGQVYRYGFVAVQTCRWWLRDQYLGGRGEEDRFPDESGDSTVVLVRKLEGGWVCIHDDPFGKLSGDFRLDGNPPPPTGAPPGVNGQVVVPAGGQAKVPTPRD